MGAHCSAESLMGGIESEAVRLRAAELAAQMNAWLQAPLTEATPLDTVPPEVAEWCRAARDVLEVASRG
jgi:hypothetical protein